MAYGQGSLTTDKRTGNIKARYWGPDGKQHCRTFKPNEKTKARDFLAEQSTEKRKGIWIDPSGAQTPFRSVAEEWFAGKHKLGHQARQRDASLLKNHVLPTFGDKPVGRISALDVRRWVNGLVDHPYSPSMISQCHRIFASVMRSAIATKLIVEAPIGKGIVDLPSLTRKRERFLSETELERLVANLPERFGRYATLLYTAAYTGCRWQELAGLRRQYLDLDRGLLHVREVQERVGGRYEIKEQPKSDAGRRTIALPRRLVNMLKADLETAQGDYVFTGVNGGVLRESNFRKRVWNPTVAAAGLAPLTFHDLRHTHASWLIRDGVQAYDLMRRLGHASIRTTMDVYGHRFPSSEDGLVATLDQRWQEAAEGHQAENAKVFSIGA